MISARFAHPRPPSQLDHIYIYTLYWRKSLSLTLFSSYRPLDPGCPYRARSPSVLRLMTDTLSVGIRRRRRRTHIIRIYIYISIRFLYPSHACIKVKANNNEINVHTYVYVVCNSLSKPERFVIIILFTRNARK